MRLEIFWIIRMKRTHLRPKRRRAVLEDASRRPAVAPHQARRVGQEVRNWQQAMDGLSVSRGRTATRPQGSIWKRCASPVPPPQNLQSALNPDDPKNSYPLLANDR